MKSMFHDPILGFEQFEGLNIGLNKCPSLFVDITNVLIKLTLKEALRNIEQFCDIIFEQLNFYNF